MTPELWLTLMSVALVLPVMIVLLFVSLSGRLGRSEDARYLPTLRPERDFWQDEEPEPATSSKEGGRDKCCRR